MAVMRNLSQAGVVWRRMVCILSREGAAPRVSGFFFQAVLQAVMLFISETWVATPCMGNDLGGVGVQAQVERRLTRQLPHRTPDRNWIYTLAATAREEAVLLTMEEYIRLHQNTVAQYIDTRSLLDLCEGSERAPGSK